ncbi:MAG TPA: cbb3-type cytochrome c oxidase subunit 3 [Vitreimonas sp.]|jgi:cytochrome c oxidase cbb3-type subunit 4|nr:cbb3-type cytochrome c oxidase subunit 3 [Vitreimonas sp.]
MSLDEAAHIAQTSGLVMLALCFVAAVIYALWPSNRQKFAKAARAPLEDGDNE